MGKNRGDRGRARRAKGRGKYGAILQGGLATRLFTRRAKLWITAALALLVASLFALFMLLGDQISIYALLLLSGSFALVLWAMPDLRLGLLATFLYLQPLLTYPANSDYTYTKAIFSLWAISLLVLVWIGGMAFRGRLKLRLPSLFWPSLLLLGALLLSLVNSEAFLADFQYVVLFLYFALFYLLLADTVNDMTRLRFALGTLVGAAALASIYALLQYFGVLEGPPDHSSGSGAMISTFGNPNYLGGFLAYLAAPGLLLLFHARSRWTRLYALVALATMTVTLVAIDSDSAWLAYVLSILVLIAGLAAARNLALLRDLWRWSVSLLALSVLLTLGLYVGDGLWLSRGPPAVPASLGEIASIPVWGGLGALALLAVSGWAQPMSFIPRRRWRWAAIGLVVAILFALAFSPGGRGFVLGLADALAGRAGVRVEDWQIGMHMFRTQPIVGIGLGDYKREFLAYKAEFLSDAGYFWRAAQAHNEYVQILAELGIVGMLVVLLLVAVIVWGVIRRLKEADSPEIVFAVPALFAGVVAFMSDAAFSFPLHLTGNALALVSLLGLLHSGSLAAGHKPKERFVFERVVEFGRSGAQFAAGGALVLGLAVSIFAYRDWRADILLNEGRAMMSYDVNQAQQLLEESADLDFAPAESLYWLGTIYLGKGDLSRSRELLERALARYHADDSYYLVALVNYRLGQMEEAKQYLEKLLATNPSRSIRVQGRYLYALTLYGTGQAESAISAFERLIEAGYQPEKMHLNLGEIYLDQGRTWQAQHHLEEALRIIERQLDQSQDPNSPRGRELQRLENRAKELLSQLSS